ncbi:MAG TPA: hypothetical protein VF230_05010 [Acidimicrobiales bacterium]
MTLLANPKVRALMVAQANVVARRQLEEVGVTDHERRWAAQHGVLRRVHPGVYVAGSAVPSFEQRLWAARLAAWSWAAVSHEAAARRHGFATYQEYDVPTLLVPHGSHPRVEGAVLHQTRDHWLVSVEAHDALLVTTPARTICDLAATTRRGRLAHVLDDAKVAKKLTYADVGSEFLSLARRGKPGFKMLGEILDERGPGHVPPLSRLERAFMELFDRFGGPRPQLAWPYPTREQVAGCADAGYADALLALETDGRRWHDRIADRKRDNDRDASAARHGVQVLRLLYEHVVGDPEGTWQLVMDTRATRLRQLGQRSA